MAKKSEVSPAPAGKKNIITPAHLIRLKFSISGISPLVVHRFSLKAKIIIEHGMTQTKTPGAGKKVREVVNFEDVFNEARYIARAKPEWDGFNAAALRKATILACKLVNFQMTLARLSFFTEADGWDKYEPQIPLIKIIGKPVMQKDVAWVKSGITKKPYITCRPAYHDWKSNPVINFDADQFSVNDIINIIDRVGAQVGLCEGRPSSDSGGLGWGLFEITNVEQLPTIHKKYNFTVTTFKE